MLRASAVALFLFIDAIKCLSFRGFRRVQTHLVERSNESGSLTSGVLATTRANTFQIRDHLALSSCAALRMTLLHRLRLTRTSSYLKCIAALGLSDFRPFYEIV